jgi:hypothetical protein
MNMEHGTTRSYRSLLIAMTIAAPLAALADHDFYGGNPDGRGWLGSQGPAETGPIVFEDARLDFSEGLYGGMFGHFRLSKGFVLQGVEMEIREGVSQGSGGNLVARVMAVTHGSTPSGFPGIHRVEGDTEFFNTLPDPQGIFYIGMRVIGIGSAELVTTSGAGGRGEPLGNGNSFFHDPLNGSTYTSTQNLLGAGTWDFSIGMIDTFVPETSTVIMFGAGCALLLMRRYRRQ